MEGHAQHSSASEEQVARAPAGKGVKRPRAALPLEEEERDVPDLADYLGSFNLLKKQQVAICRTYANHLAAALRAVEGNE